MNSNLEELERQLRELERKIERTHSGTPRNLELSAQIDALNRRIDELKATPPPQPPQPEPLREAYLKWLQEEVCDVALAGIDPKAVTSKKNTPKKHAPKKQAPKKRAQKKHAKKKQAQKKHAETCQNLGEIYTALLTFGTEYDERALEDMKKRAALLERLERGKHQLSALAQLNQHRHLVLLGDPGSGKSTFVNFVSKCLAGEYTNDPQRNIARLTAPLPDEEGNDGEERQVWEHQMLLPLRVILRDFALDGLPKAGKTAGVKHLWKFIANQLETVSLGDCLPELQRILREEGGLLLLDGLDEVPEAQERRAQIKNVVKDFTRVYQHCRVLVTSRTYAYQKQGWRLPGFKETVLAPFTKGQIVRFVNRWYSHIAPLRGIRPTDAESRATLLTRAILGNNRLYHLAERPLLLTLMSSLHAWRGGSLPEKREELYRDTVELLLDWWEGHKAQSEEGQLLSLTELLKLGPEGMHGLRRMMNRLAYEAHAEQPDLLGTANISYNSVADGLMKLSESREIKPQLVADYLRDRAGLLVPHGVDVYRFPHRTFQEYLAACYLADRDDYPGNIAELARKDPNRWREVVLLAGAKASRDKTARDATASIWYLIDALCRPEIESPEDEAENAWGALLSAQALLETTPLSRIHKRNRPKVERVKKWLMAVLTEQPWLESGNPLPAVERALAGRLLVQLGDPRSGVGFGDPRSGVGLRNDGLPDIVWCTVEGGDFMMGSEKTLDPQADEDEMPRHHVELQAFSMSRYPVTNTQYQAFVDDGGYTEKWQALWRGYGLYLREKNGWNGPRTFSNPHVSLPNHPVVGVSWFEAVVFCRWLTKRLQKAGELGGGKEIRLPSEAEWEYAARGPQGHIYPWGKEIAPEHANYCDTNLNETSAVGCFPQGKSLFSGCQEMAGNVWEWCHDDYDGSYKEASRHGRPRVVKSKDNYNVLRGGSWLANPSTCRCAVREIGCSEYGSDEYGFRVVAGLPWT